MRRNLLHHVRTLCLLCALVTVTACVTPHRQDGRRPAQAVPWIVGGWVLKGNACDSDTGVVFRPDGHWQTQDASGTWQLQGQQLVTLVTDEEGDDGTMRPVRPPLRTVERVQLLSPTEYRATGSNGRVRQLRRCR